ncbi:SagB-type dehydrogenase domain protein [Methyloversatilis sp. RAC08]|uniref:SagB/ThcOx family dehydrogenase n=1 Tax=Methyloversatilis sp. RAC08 TaxID=1842540 RepID=UPI00083E4FF6|nr:SagB/ThcOx family dehydrogenase [Methyloversatilis sp. RAC08]AOF81167.1 SagB-type dehydrogenase domain protein [Methyloversatilis sp. RAC08]
MTTTETRSAPDASASAAEVVRAYHVRTRHRYAGYAAGPETLDWDAQPAAFRHFDGAPRRALPLATDDANPARPRLDLDFAALDTPLLPLPLSLHTLGALLHLSLGLTAWKSSGPDRWAVRANPSSGNLHPVEAYLVIRGLDALADGLYHYLPETHELECRARHGVRATGSAGVHIVLTSVMWREAWKYGERAFRYCQLDTGHAVGAMRYAAAVLGWTLKAQPDIDAASLAALVGTDRLQDFPARRAIDTEIEEAELLLGIGCDGNDALPLPAIDAVQWFGPASTVDRHPMYRWAAVGEVAAATRDAVQGAAPVAAGHPAGARATRAAAAPARRGRSIGEVLLGRRSAQRFDPRTVMARDAFDRLLERLQPSGGMPWDALPGGWRIDLLLFVHRVEGLSPGVYLLSRGGVEQGVPARLARQHDLLPVDDAAVPLYQLAAMEPMALARLARSLHCHQDIAANGCVALGMLCEFEAALAASAANYRDLHRQAGLIGQVLYAEAEAMGLRGTGIGCFFDDAVHELIGLEGTAHQTLYHFTLGRAIDDARIESSPAYAQRTPAASEPTP